MKVFYYALVFSLLAVSSWAQVSPGSRLVSKPYSGSPGVVPHYGYLEYTPASYPTAPNGSLPLVIALHGIGKVGTNLDVLKTEGLPMLIASGHPIAYNNEFIVIAPQSPVNWEWFNSINKFIAYIISIYPKADANRIYLTGLSYGGSATWRSAWESNYMLAAIMPISQCGNVKPMQMTRVAVMAFDGDYAYCQKPTVDEIKGLGGHAKHTQINSGAHNAWDDTYKNQATWDSLLVKRRIQMNNYPPVVNAGDDQAITLPTNSKVISGSVYDPELGSITYSWTKQSGPTATMSGANSANLSLTNLVAGTYVFRLTGTDNGGTIVYDDVTLKVNPVPNAIPKVNAGADKVITLPVNSITLTGTASDSDGTISSYLWTKQSGPSATMSGTTGLTLSLSNLVAGSYVFRLTVKDNSNASAYDDVIVKVNIAPTANAGADKTIALPTNTTTLTGSGADTDGTIASYLWTKQSGPTVTMGATNGASISLSDLLAGVYVFRLKVTDNNGGSAFDDVTLTVTGSNIAPVANAGADKSITLPTNSLIIVGSGSDSDGTIASYAWTEVSGPTVTMSGASTTSLSLSNLVQGTYVFRLTVQDNGGATAIDDVTVIVSPAPNVNPVANAGADQSITLPTNSTALSGSGTDSDGTIASYAWAKVSGPTVTMSGANTASLSLSNLLEGTYVFRLTVQDNAGATAIDDVTVVVSPAPNVNPVANAGTDQSITLPTNSLIIVGSGSDSDGSITAYDWTQLSGPSPATLTNSTSSTVSISNLVEGTYSFQLSVIDNVGAMASDVVAVVVNAPVVYNPIYRINAGGSAIIASPLNWESDSPTQSSHLYAAFSNVGGCNCLTENTTGIPDAVFTSNRQTTSSGGLQWNFAVSNGTYTVNLYFAEFWSGTRKFKIVMENIVKELSYEIAAEFGLNKAGKKTYTVSVTDGNLDIDLITVLNGAVISGIEIIPTGTARIAKEEETVQVEMPYPNPTTDKIYISLPGQNGKAMIAITDGVAKTLTTGNVEIVDEKLELSVTDLPAGIHHLLIKSGSKTKFVRFIKE
jgi:hypothetical protein